MIVAKSLRWREEKRYYKNSSLDWSPWGPIFQDQLDPYWLEVARRLHNKGVKELLFFWDEKSKDWKTDPGAT